MWYKVTLILLIIVLCLTGIYSCNKSFLLLWNANNIYVDVKDNISKEKVKIEFGISLNTINHEADTKVFFNRNKYSILFDGNLRNKIANEYGENDFLIIYDERCYLSFRHFKTNLRHQHDYYFNFFNHNGNIFVTVEIKGENPLHFSRSLIDISQQFSLPEASRMISSCEFK